MILEYILVQTFIEGFKEQDRGWQGTKAAPLPLRTIWNTFRYPSLLPHPDQGGEEGWELCEQRLGCLVSGHPATDTTTPACL